MQQRIGQMCVFRVTCAVFSGRITRCQNTLFLRFILLFLLCLYNRSITVRHKVSLAVH